MGKIYMALLAGAISNQQNRSRKKVLRIDRRAGRQVAQLCVTNWRCIIHRILTHVERSFSSAGTTRAPGRSPPCQCVRMRTSMCVLVLAASASRGVPQFKPLNGDAGPHQEGGNGLRVFATASLSVA